MSAPYIIHQPLRILLPPLVNIISSSKFRHHAFNYSCRDGGDIIQSLDNGKNWTTSAQLNVDFSISTLYDMVYNKGTGLYNAADYISTTNSGINDPKVNTALLASADGHLWENTDIPHFNRIFATPNSYCAIENDTSDPTSIGQIWCWGNNQYGQLGNGESG